MSSWQEIFTVFFRLGLTSFGGPVAHLGYFRTEFVERRQWLDDRAYGELVAMAQFLPGPSSSQVGMAIGLMRAGFAGLFAAWAGFTLPSVLLLVGFASGTALLSASWLAGLTHGLMIVAVAVVAQAVLQMSRTLAPDWLRGLLVLLAFAVLLVLPSVMVQIIVLIAGGVLGAAFLESKVEPDHPTFSK